MAGYDEYIKLGGAKKDKEPSLEKQVINISKDLLSKFDKLIERSRNIGDTSLEDEILQYYDKAESSDIDINYAKDIFGKYAGFDKRINDIETEITKK